MKKVFLTIGIIFFAFALSAKDPIKKAEKSKSVKEIKQKSEKVIKSVSKTINEGAVKPIKKTVKSVSSDIQIKQGNSKKFKKEEK